VLLFSEVAIIGPDITETVSVRAKRSKPEEKVEQRRLKAGFWLSAADLEYYPDGLIESR